MEPSRANILHSRIDLIGDSGNFLDSLIGENQFDLLSFQEGLILHDQGILGLFEDADEILLTERGQFDPYRKPALELGNEVGRLGDVERSGGDEKNMIGLHHPVLGGHG